jgi:hypothetical protein
MRQFLVIFPASMAGAVIGYFLGGKGATAASPQGQTFGGLSIQFGGVLVGFVLIWSLSTRFIDKRVAPEHFPVRLRLRGSPAFSKNAHYRGTYTITHKSGDPTEPIPFDGPQMDDTLIVLHLPQVKVEDQISATVLNEDGLEWKTKTLLLLEPFGEANGPKKAKPVSVTTGANRVTTDLTVPSGGRTTNSGLLSGRDAGAPAGEGLGAAAGGRSGIRDSFVAPSGGGSDRPATRLGEGVEK